MSEEKKPSVGDEIMRRAMHHYSAIGLRKIEVPEWETTLFYRPVTTTERQDALREGALRGGGEYTMSKIIILKALDADGNRVFNASHQHWLMTQVYSAVVERIAEAFLSKDLEPEKPPAPGDSEQETAAKN